MFEGNVVLLGIVVSAIKSAPVVAVARTFYRSPLAFVFRGDLIPILREIRSYVAVSRDITHEEGRKAGVARGAA